MHDYTRLRVWQRARQLVVEIHRETDGLEQGIHATLTAQLQEAAVGVVTHIEQGTGQPTPTLFARSLLQAVTCASDVISVLSRARDLGAVPATRHVMLDMEAQEVRRMLHALRGKVIERIRGGRVATKR